MLGTVAIVVSSFFGGGAEKSMLALHQGLTKHGVDCTFVSINENLNSPVKESEALVEIGRRRDSGLFNTFLSFLKFRTFLSRKKPDVIILNCDLPELFGGLLALSRNSFAIVVIEHANPSWPSRRAVGWAVRKILLHRSAKFVAVSSHITYPFGARIYDAVIPNLVDNLSEVPQHVVSSQVNRLVYIGRLTSVYKSPQSLLQISRETGFPVVFFGEGELLSELRSKSIDQGVQAVFRGWVDDPWAEISSGDLLIVPSEREGDGLVVVESIARGIPVLLRDVIDLRRFGLRDLSYCSSDLDFTERIKEYKNDLFKLRPPNEVREKLLGERDSAKLTKDWIRFLDQV